MKIALLFCLLLFAGCTQTSHIPAPWELPGAVIGTTFENAIYGSRRKKVKRFIQANYSQLKSDVAVGQGDALSELFETAKVKSKRQELLDELRNSESTYFVDESLAEQGLEKLVVVVMVYSD